MPDTDSRLVRVALVTGGSRGIGRAVVEALLAEGFAVFFCSRNPDSVGAAERDLQGRFPGRVSGRAVDVRRQSEVDACVAWVTATAGRIDCLVNNAGTGAFEAVDALDGDTWREVVETNLCGAFYGIRAVAPHMRRQGSGWIFNVASLAGRNPFAGGAAYNASKFGLVGLSEAAMLDLRHDGVRVTAILPGSVDTGFHQGRRPQREWMLAPQDVARVVVDCLRFPDRALPSLVELRPSRPPRK
ncbi:MAG TPA: SDR family oxidoreductase [Thermoanaerobaculia bacterium]|nr:SDR family oxidoreductase [Thermoanaerobaculia bacterium]